MLGNLIEEKEETARVFNNNGIWLLSKLDIFPFSSMTNPTREILFIS